MNVKELNKEQLQQLKIRYLDDLLQEEEGRNISYGEMANIDENVSDKIIYDLYESTTFVDEDFF